MLEVVTNPKKFLTFAPAKGNLINVTKSSHFIKYKKSILQTGSLSRKGDEIGRLCSRNRCEEKCIQRSDGET